MNKEQVNELCNMFTEGVFRLKVRDGQDNIIDYYCNDKRILILNTLGRDVLSLESYILETKLRYI